MALAAAILWQGDLGWTLFANDLANLAVTVLWVLGIVNAFNLMDNLDGAAATVAGASAAGIALLAAYEARGRSRALCGGVRACAGFHFNLTRPARIFMGDGGSMLLGFVAALAMAVWRLNGMAGTAFPPAILLAGLPIFDMTTTVIVSRLRRGAPAQGGRDHTTHRLLPIIGSTSERRAHTRPGSGRAFAGRDLVDGRKQDRDARRRRRRLPARSRHDRAA